MNIEALFPPADSVQRLVEAVWQCLDDMRVHGRCVCGLAHAELRAAYEPFRTPGDHCDDFMPLEMAKQILKELT